MVILHLDSWNNQLLDKIHHQMIYEFYSIDYGVTYDNETLKYSKFLIYNLCIHISFYSFLVMHI